MADTKGAANAVANAIRVEERIVGAVDDMDSALNDLIFVR